MRVAAGRRARLPTVLIVAGLVAAGCGGDGAPVVSAPTGSTSAPGTAGAGAVPAPNVPLAPPSLPAPAPTGGVAVGPGGVPVAVVGGSDGQWRVRTPCDEEVVLDAVSYLPAVEVVVDPGHGGSESGAVGPGGTREADVNLAIAERLVARLRSAGRTAVLTRTGDYQVSIASRAELAVRAGATVFVSVHNNTVPDGPAAGPGTEAYFQAGSPDSRRLAGLLHEETSVTLSTHEVAWVADTDAGAKPRVNSAGTDYYGLLRQAAGVTSVLLEVAFLSNPPEEALLIDPAVQDELAAAVGQGIERYLTTGDPGSGFVDPYPRAMGVGGDGAAGPGCIDPPL